MTKRKEREWERGRGKNGSGTGGVGRICVRDWWMRKTLTGEEDRWREGARWEGG